MKNIDFRVLNDNAIIASLSVAADKMTDRCADALRKAGGKLETESIKRTPVDTGELRSRAFNEGPLKDGDTYVQVVGYEKHIDNHENRYAVPVHEETSVHHRVGEAKFLENAVKAFESEFAAYIASIVKKGGFK